MMRGSTLRLQTTGRRLNSSWGHLTVDRLLEIAARVRPDRRCFIDTPDRTSFDQGDATVLTSRLLAAKTEAYARQFLALGLAPGEVVIAALPNTSCAVAAWLGLVTAGLCPCTITVAATADEMEAAARLTGAVAILTVDRYADMMPSLEAREAARRHLSLRLVATLDRTAVAAVTSLADWGPGESFAGVLPTPEPTDAALVTIDTAGNTPTAHVRSHAQLIADALNLAANAGLGGHCSLVSTLGLATAAGVVTTVIAPLVSSTVTHLHGPFSVPALQTQAGSGGAMVVALPERAEACLPALPLAEVTGVIIHHRSMVHETLARAPLANLRCTDLVSLGETCMLALSRDQRTSHSGGLPVFSSHPVSSALARTDHHVALMLGDTGALLATGFGVAQPIGAQPQSRLGPAVHPTGFTALQQGADMLVVTGRLIPPEQPAAKAA